MQRRRGRRNQAFTLVELCLAVGVVVVIALVLLPTLRDNRAKSQRIACVGNLKQLGVAFRIFAVDQGEGMPMQVWTNETDQPVGFPLRYFLGMSNELSTPSILHCPADSRSMVSDFSLLSRLGLSYFVGLDAVETYPQSLLSGDRNLVSNGVPVSSGLITMVTNATWGWGKDMHRRSGNVALADGSAHSSTDQRLRQLTARGANRLVIP